jgi:hypothetical protein
LLIWGLFKNKFNLFDGGLLSLDYLRIIHFVHLVIFYWATRSYHLLICIERNEGQAHMTSTMTE